MERVELRKSKKGEASKGKEKVMEGCLPGQIRK